MSANIYAREYIRMFTNKSTTPNGIKPRAYDAISMGDGLDQWIGVTVSRDALSTNRSPGSGLALLHDVFGSDFNKTLEIIYFG